MYKLLLLVSLLFIADAAPPSIHGEHTVHFNSPTVGQLSISLYWDPGNDRSRLDYATADVNETVWRRLDNNVIAVYIHEPSLTTCCQLGVFGATPYQTWIGTAPTQTKACSTYPVVQFYSGLWYEDVALYMFAHVELGFIDSKVVCVRYKDATEDVTYPITYTEGTPDPQLFNINFPPGCTCLLSETELLERLSKRRSNF